MANPGLAPPDLRESCRQWLFQYEIIVTVGGKCDGQADGVVLGDIEQQWVLSSCS
ncbi:MAG: hypothetical protein MZV63_39450 [Marinilabiliales bacterium]|nr:hypothetical protein [Marinilabiliales bacterium]